MGAVYPGAGDHRGDGVPGAAERMAGRETVPGDHHPPGADLHLHDGAAGAPGRAGALPDKLPAEQHPELPGKQGDCRAPGLYRPGRALQPDERIRPDDPGSVCPAELRRDPAALPLRPDLSADVPSAGAGPYDRAAAGGQPGPAVRDRQAVQPAVLFAVRLLGDPADAEIQDDVCAGRADADLDAPGGKLLLRRIQHRRGNASAGDGAAGGERKGEDHGTGVLPDRADGRAADPGKADEFSAATDLPADPGGTVRKPETAVAVAGWRVGGLAGHRVPDPGGRDHLCRGNGDGRDQLGRAAELHHRIRAGSPGGDGHDLPEDHQAVRERAAVPEHRQRVCRADDAAAAEIRQNLYAAAAGLRAAFHERAGERNMENAGHPAREHHAVHPADDDHDVPELDLRGAGVHPGTAGPVFYPLRSAGADLPEQPMDPAEL